jgi:hypothetical protein
MYIRLINSIPTNYSIEQLRRDNPQVSFNKEPTEETLTEYDVYFVTMLPKPEYDFRTHYLKQSDFYQVEDKWQVHYTPEKLPYEQAANTIREERDKLLTSSDWTQVDDTPLTNAKKIAWAQYRQALRDIPQQEEFPFNVFFPQQP